MLEIIFVGVGLDLELLMKECSFVDYVLSVYYELYISKYIFFFVLRILFDFW